MHRTVVKRKLAKKESRPQKETESGPTDYTRTHLNIAYAEGARVISQEMNDHQMADMHSQPIYEDTDAL